MKIKDLLEALTTPTIQRDKRLSHEYDLDQMVYDREFGPVLRGGWYSKGEPGQDPHEYEVSTWLPTNLRYDAKYHWIKAIYPYMGDNIHLPVYYNIRFERDKNSLIRTKYTMERLVKLDSLNSKQLQSLAATTFNDDSFYEIDVTPDKISQMIRHLMVDMKHRQTPRYSVDAELNQAIELIVDLLEKNKIFVPDLGNENIMVRNTGNGLQLVITDPISDNGISIREPNRKI